MRQYLAASQEEEILGLSGVPDGREVDDNRPECPSGSSRLAFGAPPTDEVSCLRKSIRCELRNSSPP